MKYCGASYALPCIGLGKMVSGFFWTAVKSAMRAAGLLDDLWCEADLQSADYKRHLIISVLFFI